LPIRESAPLRQRFVDHALGYLYFIQNEGGMPELGLADDEFQDNGHLPYQICVREGRRIVGRYCLAEADIHPFVRGDGFRAPPHADAIAIGDWAIESQGCADEVPSGYSDPDGCMINRVARATFQIPYRCLLPQGVDNLLTCGAISATHALGGGACPRPAAHPRPQTRPLPIRRPRTPAIWFMSGAALVARWTCRPTPRCAGR
jgi:hypothetical protein